MNYTYAIDEDNTVKIFVVGTDFPLILQPFNPDNKDKDWKNRAEAEKWAQNKIVELEARETPTNTTDAPAK
jgi:hypothetical protein